MSEALKILITQRIAELGHWIDGKHDRQEKLEKDLENTIEALAHLEQERTELQNVLDGIYAREVPEA